MSLVLTLNGTQVVAAGRFASLNGVKATGVGGARRGHRRDPSVRDQPADHQPGRQLRHLQRHDRRRERLRHRLRLRRPGQPRGLLRGDGRRRRDRGDQRLPRRHLLELPDERCRSTWPATRTTAGRSAASPSRSERVHKFASAYTPRAVRCRWLHDLRQQEPRRPARGQAARLVPDHDRPAPTPARARPAGASPGNGQYVVYGGEFPRVNGVRAAGPGPVRRARARAEQGRPRRRPRGHGDLAAAPAWRRSPGPTTDDQDNEYLTYRSTATGVAAPVDETVRRPRWWQHSRADGHRRPASAGVARATASSPPTRSATRRTGDVGRGRRSSPRGHDRGDLRGRRAGRRRAVDHWRLGETSGATAADAIGGRTMTVGVGRDPRRRRRPDRRHRHRVHLQRQRARRRWPPRRRRRRRTPSPSRRGSRPRSSAGGRIVGFGNAATGNSSDLRPARLHGHRRAG